MPDCKICNSKKSSRWYAGPICNKCYCKHRRQSPKFKNDQKIYNEQYRKRKAEVLKEKRTSEKGRAYFREYQKLYSKKESVKEYRKAYKRTEEYKAKDRARRRANYKKDPGKYKAITALKSRRTRQATPPWVDKEELLRIYRECPPGMEVDHIMPIKHDLFCGLHVPWNLQYLTPFQNRSKKNRV